MQFTYANPGITKETIERDINRTFPRHSVFYDSQSDSSSDNDECADHNADNNEYNEHVLRGSNNIRCSRNSLNLNDEYSDEKLATVKAWGRIMDHLDKHLLP